MDESSIANPKNPKTQISNWTARVQSRISAFGLALQDSVDFRIPFPRLVAALAISAVFILVAHAEVPSWLQWMPSSSPAINILYRTVPSIGGPIPVRRPPRETTVNLAAESAKSPTDAELIAVTAREYEAQLDFVNAEDRWKLFQTVSPDRAAGQIALADFYHRRMQPQQELQTLTAAAATLPATDDPLQPDVAQRAWQANERIQQLIQIEAMPAAAALQNYEAWITKYPRSGLLHQRFFDFLIQNNMVTRAAQVLDQYQRSFPNDRIFPIHAKTLIAEKRGSPGGAIAVYDAAFDPLWPPQLLDGYFKLLDDSHKSFDFYQNARKSAAARPLDLEPAARLFHYHRKQSDLTAARRELSEFRVRKEAAHATWTASELNTLAKLCDSVSDHDETIRYAFALYSLNGADAASTEAALAQIIETLLKAPDQPIRFGRGDLSFYHDIATIDRSPGFLNGILSLVFNSQNPDSQYQSQQVKGEAYFHRAKAAELYALLSRRFPNSSRRSELLSRLIDSYAIYGEDEPIIRQGTAFINDFPNAAQRTKVALQVADAYARRKQVPEELAVYTRLLGELASKAQQVPLGAGEQPRSTEYAQVLQRNISRLTQLSRIPDALALYRSEIDRNPNDPGLYDRLADFLGANQRGPEVEQVYRQAMQRFQNPSWRHKLARFYLRNRRASELRDLSREVVNAFSGSDLESYFTSVVADAAFERRLQLEINLYAYARFPHDLRLVNNLITLYTTPGTADANALMRLLSNHWYEDEAIRRMYFERLAASGSLLARVQEAVNLVPADSRGRWPQSEAENPAATRFIAEAETWLSHFEEAAPVMRAIADAYPADAVFAGRATDLHRSLAAFDPANTAAAVTIAEKLARSQPRNRSLLTQVGEIYADRELMTPARDIWVRHAEIEPGKPDGYLEAATLFWDYVRPADAVSWLQRGRTRLKDPALWSYEMGAILESQDRRAEAVAEYIKGSLSPKGGPAQARLLQLATRQAYKSLVDEQISRRVQSSPGDTQVLELRVAVLRAQQRDDEIQALLRGIVDQSSSREILSYVRRVAAETALRPLQERVIRREIQLEVDPEEQLRLRIELALFLETGGDASAAGREIDALYQANPLISGVIRAAADFHWRHDKPRAVQILAAAAAAAHESLKKDYLVETVRRSIEAGDQTQAIQAAQNLLRIDPINGQAVGLMAEALAAAGKESELQQLYASKIAEIQQAPISVADKTDRTAAMRRGLIPVLVRQQKFREALDQFIEIINRFPDDDTIVAEAARLASQHGLRSQLSGYYAKTVETSPRDHRWSIVLARVHTQFEDYPAAIRAYATAMAARPERQDLAAARADLEERTFRFADAISTYNKIYELSHRDPLWLERIAVLQIRLGQDREALSTLQRAFIENRPEVSREYGRVARVLEENGLVDAAVDFIKRQIERGKVHQREWEQLYARIMARSRKYDEALTNVIGFENVSASRALGQAVAMYYTPEERQAFASRLTEGKAAANPQNVNSFIEIANAAGLHDLEIAWKIEQAAERSADEGFFGEGPFIRLQQSRMRFAELARQLEDLSTRISGNNQRVSVLSSAVRAYQMIGDADGELRLMTARPELQTPFRQRYFELLARARPDDLLRIASSGDPTGLLATQALIAAGDSTRALQAIRAQRRTPVWTDAYTGLVGLHFGLNTVDTRTAFQRALGPQVIEENLGKPVSRSNQLAGDIWFYYGQRYGEYLRDAGQLAESSEYLLSEVEQRPGDPQAYLQLARYYRDSSETQRAIGEFRHVLELNDNRPDVYSSIALMLWDAGRRDEALTEWKNGLTRFERTPDPATGAALIGDIRSRQQVDALHTAIDTALRAAARRLQVWQMPALMQAAFENSADNAWLLGVVQASRSPGQLHGSLAEQPWLSPQQQKFVFQQAVNALSSATAANRFQYVQMRQRYLEYLLDHNETADAKQLLDSLTAAEKRSPNVRTAELRLAAIDGSLDGVLERYRQSSADAPDDWSLQETAALLVRKGQPAASDKILEFLYSRQIEFSSRNTAAFMGLAQVRLKQSQVNDAAELLRRLNRMSAGAFDNLLESGRLLLKAGRQTEAQEFFKLRAQAVPWDDEARLELARTQVASSQQAAAAENLQRVVLSRQAAYDIRTQAAAEQSKAGSRPGGTAGSRELDLLSGRIPLTAASADAPYFFAARLAAAERSADRNDRVRMLLGAIAEHPEAAAVRRLLFSTALEARQSYIVLAAYFREGNVYSEPEPDIAAGMAEAYLQTGKPGDAARSFGFAAMKETDPARKKALEDRRKQATVATERLMENERRRPMMRAELDQPNPVRRRLP